MGPAYDWRGVRVASYGKGIVDVEISDARAIHVTELFTYRKCIICVQNRGIAYDVHKAIVNNLKVHRGLIFEIPVR